MSGVDHLEKALRYNPQAPDYSTETLAHLPACYAQRGRMDEAEAAARTFKEGCPTDSDFDFYAAAHARLCKHSEDAEHWLEGYRKAGLLD